MKRRIKNAILGRFQVLNNGQIIDPDDLEFVEKDGDVYKMRLNGNYAVRFLSLLFKF